jgi:hypothetical protein
MTEKAKTNINLISPNLKNLIFFKKMRFSPFLTQQVFGLRSQNREFLNAVGAEPDHIAQSSLAIVKPRASAAAVWRCDDFAMQAGVLGV